MTTTITPELLTLIQNEINSVCYSYFSELADDKLSDSIDEVESENDLDLSGVLDQIRIQDIQITLSTK